MSANAEGENMCACFQSRKTSEGLMSEYFDVIEMLPGARASTSKQDIYLLKKR
jgi:hypothetical protein